MIPHIQQVLKEVTLRTGACAMLVIGGPTLERQGRMSVTW